MSIHRHFEVLRLSKHKLTLSMYETLPTIHTFLLMNKKLLIIIYLNFLSTIFNLLLG